MITIVMIAQYKAEFFKRHLKDPDYMEIPGWAYNELSKSHSLVLNKVNKKGKGVSEKLLPPGFVDILGMQVKICGEHCIYMFWKGNEKAVSLFYLDEKQKAHI